MSARFEVVRTDAKQPWHARLRVNGRITWTTETYTRKVGAQRAIVSLVHIAAGAEGYEAYLSVDGSAVRLYDGDRTLVADVTYVDERDA